MAKSVSIGKIPGNNCNKEESELFIPFEESEFKPRLNANVCQYCGYTSNKTGNVNIHVNSRHEMKILYKCKYCEHITFNSGNMKRHIGLAHKLQVSLVEVKRLIMRDPIEIDCVKRSQLEKRRVPLRPLMVFRPIDKQDFKPRIDPVSCQYCNYTYHIKRHVDQHVNVNHEMTLWYGCVLCKYVSLSKWELRHHVMRLHNRYLPFSSLDSHVIKDEEMIEHLKETRIKLKIQGAQGQLLRPSTEELSNFGKAKFIESDKQETEDLKKRRIHDVEVEEHYPEADIEEEQDPLAIVDEGKRSTDASEQNDPFEEWLII